MHQHLSTDEIKNFQQLASAALASCPQVPVIAIDLDYTIWPSNCFEHTMPPYSNPHPKSEDNCGVIPDYIACKDRRNNQSRMLPLYPETKHVLEWCADHHIVLTICSRSPDVSIVEQIMRAFGIWDWFLFPQVFHKTKSYHFRNLSEATNFKMKDFLFFDDDMNNIKTCSKMGVTSYLVDKQSGLNWTALIDGLKLYATQIRTMNSFQNWFIRTNSSNALLSGNGLQEQQENSHRGGDGGEGDGMTSQPLQCESTIAASFDSHDMMSIDLYGPIGQSNGPSLRIDLQHIPPAASSSSSVSTLTMMSQTESEARSRSSSMGIGSTTGTGLGIGLALGIGIGGQEMGISIGSYADIPASPARRQQHTLLPASSSPGSSQGTPQGTPQRSLLTSTNNLNLNPLPGAFSMELNQYSGSCGSNNNVLPSLIPYHINTSFHLPSIHSPSGGNSRSNSRNNSASSSPRPSSASTTMTMLTTTTSSSSTNTATTNTTTNTISASPTSYSGYHSMSYSNSSHSSATTPRHSNGHNSSGHGNSSSSNSGSNVLSNTNTMYIPPSSSSSTCATPRRSRMLMQQQQQQLQQQQLQGSRNPNNPISSTSGTSSNGNSSGHQTTSLYAPPILPTTIPSITTTTHHHPHPISIQSRLESIEEIMLPPVTTTSILTPPSLARINSMQSQSQSRLFLQTPPSS